jgi:hypothetical protein
MTASKTSHVRARSLDNQAKALELRRMGFGYAAIAEQIGVGKSQAHRYVVAGLDDARAQISASADELKSEEISRLDGMLAAIWPKARKGDCAAIDRVLKIAERRAKLLGLDAPTRTALEGGGDGTPPIQSAVAQVVFFMPENGR